MFRRSFVSLVALALIGVAPMAQAQTNYIFFPNDTTINGYVGNTAFIGFANESDYYATPFRNPTSPTVNLIDHGYIDGSLYVHNKSTLNMSGGRVNDGLHGSFDCTINFSGGSVYGISITNNATLNLRGGYVNGLAVNGDSVLNIFGTNLTAPLINPDVLGLRLYFLSGMLQDGTVLVNKTIYMENGGTAHFTLNDTSVPEPSSGFVIGFGTVSILGAMLLRRRKFSR